MRFAVLFCALSAAAYAAELAGRVVEDHTGNPLASAEVRVVKPGQRTLAADLETGGDGRFSVPNLPPGEYRLEVRKPNFIDTVLRLEQPSTGLELRLVRAGVITGSVVDAHGQPVRGATIYALPRSAGGGPLRSSANDRGVRLNERGQYRIHSLAPGEYAVAVTYGASTAAFGSSGGADIRQELGSGSVLYPENASPRFFPVAGGEEYRNIDFSLIPTDLHSISGKIELPDPKSTFWLALIPTDRNALAAAVAKTSAGGAFRFEGIPGGNYTLTAAGPILGYGGKGIPGDTPYYGRASMNVAADVENVAVPVAKGVEVSFVLRATGPPGDCLSTAQVTLAALEDFAVRIDRTGTVGSGKETTIANLAPARFQVTARELGEGCYQAGDAELDLTNSVPKGPVTIEVAQAGALRGTLAGAAKGSRYLIALAPADALAGSQPLQAVFADGAGRFAFTGLRPGRYRVSIQPAAGGVAARWLNPAARMIEIEIPGGSPTEIELPAPAKQE